MSLSTITDYADKSLFVLAIIILLALAIVGAYESGMNAGIEQGKKQVVCPKVRVEYRRHNQMDWYSPVELRRIARARERMEKVK